MSTFALSNMIVEMVKMLSRIFNAVTACVPRKCSKRHPMPTRNPSCIDFRRVKHTPSRQTPLISYDDDTDTIYALYVHFSCATYC